MADSVAGTYENPDPETLTHEQLEFAIKTELERWGKTGISTNQITHDMFALDAQIMTVVKVLIEAEVITEVEFQTKFRRVLLSKLQNIRESVSPIMLQHTLTQGLVDATGKPFDPKKIA